MGNGTIGIHLYHECMGKHSHTYPQIMVPLKKNMTVEVEDQEYLVTPQELIFVPDGMNHRCDFLGDLLVLNICDDIGEQGKIMLAGPIIVSMRGQILQLVELIQAELRNNPNSTSVRFLYDFLYSKLLENNAPPSIRYISEHYDLPITIDELAEMESYNVTYYNDWFKQQTGISPGLYLRRVRIEKAKELLRNSAFGVTDVAVTVGYSSNSTFTRAFRSITGMTPKDYRESVNGKQRAAK